MKISSVKTFKSKVLQAVQLIYDATSKPKAHSKYSKIGIEIDYYQDYVRSKSSQQTCKILFFYNNNRTCFYSDGTDLHLSEIDKGTFFNARIMGKDFKTMFMSCIASELNKRFNNKQRYEQEYKIYIDVLLKYLNISL